MLLQTFLRTVRKQQEDFRGFTASEWPGATSHLNVLERFLSGTTRVLDNLMLRSSYVNSKLQKLSGDHI